MKKFAVFLIFVFLFGAFSFMGNIAPASADDVSDLQQKIEERNANIKKLEEEIKKYQAEADKTSAAARTLANTIAGLRATGKKLDTDIKVTQNKIAAASLTIEKLSIDIGDKESRIEKSREAISENIRLLNRRDAVSIVQTFLQTKNIAQAWNELEELITLQTSLKNHIGDLDSTKEALEGDKNETEEKKNSLKEFETTLSGQKQVIAANTNEQNKLLSETKSQEAAFQQLVKDRAAAKAALEKEVFEYESKLKYILDPSSIPSAGSSPFSWPTDDVYITQQFGRTSASGRLYASGSHNGLDLKALMGTPIKAMADGTVSGTGDTDLTCPRASFGRWILIKHNNGLAATFAHLSVVSVKMGDTVKRGQIIGYSGNTGYSTGPHLHVSVYPNDGVSAQSRPSASCGGKVYFMPIAAVNAYLDPMLYFPSL